MYHYVCIIGGFTENKKWFQFGQLFFYVLFSSLKSRAAFSVTTAQKFKPLSCGIMTGFVCVYI